VSVDGGTREIAGGRVFFSGARRSLVQEDEVRLTSVGIDIGSSTSHLMFSRLVLERLDTRYVVAERTALHQSDILLTPYTADGEIAAQALGAFIDAEYARAGLARDDVDTGAIILTGVAVRRRNARAIGDLFAAESGRFVALSAGDALETMLAARGSGATALSATGEPVVNIDIGGGTTKIAVCENGHVTAMTAVETGARLIVVDDTGRISRLERFGAWHAEQQGCHVAPGAPFGVEARRAVAEGMAEQVMAALDGAADPALLRLPQLQPLAMPMRVVVSGGVAEFVSGAEARDFGDLGPWLAQAVADGLAKRGMRPVPARQGIRATVVGASQYSVQVSGSTVFLDPDDVLPLRNVATIRPELDLSTAVPDPDAIAVAVRAALARMDLDDGGRPVAVSLAWRGSASYGRLDAVARGLVAGMAPVLAAGHPLVVVSDRDVGGLLGMHCREEGLLTAPIVSIDGIGLAEFDFVDLGAVLAETGAVPVVVKSLIFPGDGA